MSTPVEAEKQARIDEFKNAPRKVQLAALCAFSLGLITFLRVLARSYAMDLSIGKGAFYGALLLFWFLIAGGSLYSRSRWGYVGLCALTVFPLLGLAGLSTHLIRLAIEGTMATSWPETIHCIAALAQFATTCLLFRYLLAKEVLNHVWKPEK